MRRRLNYKTLAASELDKLEFLPHHIKDDVVKAVADLMVVVANDERGRWVTEMRRLMHKAG